MALGVLTNKNHASHAIPQDMQSPTLVVLANENTHRMQSPTFGVLTTRGL